MRFHCVHKTSHSIKQWLTWATDIEINLLVVITIRYDYNYYTLNEIAGNKQAYIRLLGTRKYQNDEFPMTEEYVRYCEEISAIHRTLKITGRIQFVALTTLRLKFQIKFEVLSTKLFLSPLYTLNI